jgi:two-component system, chemotaxis family, protein-glutamate methylesterase/glutaminase
VSRDLVVIGSSWGGLVALEKILSALPKDFEPAIAIAQHRSVDSGSGALSAMLGRHTALEVCEAGDKEPIEPGHVYIAPPDYHLYVEQGAFALDVDDAVQYSRPSIDVLFDSAADVYGDRLAAVILTGANQDGAYGIKRVKRRGGLTIAQDPATAVKADMPAAAIATGAVDKVLSLDEIGPVLAGLGAHQTDGSRA